VLEEQEPVVQEQVLEDLVMVAFEVQVQEE